MPLCIWRLSGSLTNFGAYLWTCFCIDTWELVVLTRLLYDWHQLLKSSSLSWNEECCHHPCHRCRRQSCTQRHHHPESVTSLQQTYPWQLPLFWPQKILVSHVCSPSSMMKMERWDWYHACGVAQNSNLKIGTSSAEFKIRLCYWLKNSSCVDHSTRKIRRSTHEKPDVGVSKSKIHVSHALTQQIFAVCTTRHVPLRRPFFGETIFVWTRRVVAKN